MLEVASLPPLESAEISFEAETLTDAYPNFFQTSDGPRALRLELVQPARLHLALGDGIYLKVADHFPLQAWQKFHVTFIRGKRVEVRLDGHVVFRSEEPRLTNLEPAFDRFVVGTGFARQRNYVGEIRGFSFKATYREPPAPWKRLLLAGLTGLAVVVLVRLLRPATPAPEPGSAEHWPQIGLAAIGLTALFGALGWFAFTHPLPLGKWNLLFFLAPLLLLPAHFGPYRMVTTSRWGTWLLAGIGLAAAAWFGWSNWLLLPTSNRDLVWALPAILAVIALGSPGENRLRAAWQAMCAGAVGLIVTGALSPLPNWRILADAYAARPSLVLGLLTVLCVSMHRACLPPAPAPDPASPPGRKLAAALPYALFAFLALRQDSLFTAGSEMHWEYYVGPIRTVREGGWLLWDTPSQYGFLNILLPTLLPVASAWQAFYLFQAAVLFVCSVLCYRLVRESLAGRGGVAALLVAVLFFFADPSLIGPAPYPSSSGMRFLWVYVLLAEAALLLNASADALPRFVRRATWSWLAGVAWSAESALYCSVVFLAPVLLIAHFRWLRCSGWQETLCLLLRPLIALAGFVLALCLYYRLRLGHWPDLSMHFLYATAYAHGFGEMPLTWHGPLWLFGLVIALGLALQTRAPLDSTPTAALAVPATSATVWIVATYFVGRAVPENVTALLPLLGLGLFLMHHFARKDARLAEVTLVTRPALSCFLGVVTAAFLTAVVLERPKIPAVGLARIDERLRSADAELDALVEQAGVPPGAMVVYYGHAASMPRLARVHAFERTWLPSPLQLLEAPVAPERREEIFSRYLSRRREEGYIIQARNQFEDRFERWLALLSATHEQGDRFESEHYRILRFQPRPASR